MGEVETNELPKPRKANKLASVPVALLIAMTPAMMNGTEPVKAIPLDNENLTELLAYAAPSEIASPEPQVARAQSSYPLGLKFLGNKKIFETRSIVTTNGERANIVYAGEKKWDGAPNTKHAQFIYYIPKNHNLPNDAIYFPTIEGIIYHDLGEGKEFGGIKVRIPEYKAGNLNGYTTKEIRLKDDDINDIIDFMANEKAYKNNVLGLKAYTTTSPNLQQPTFKKY